MTILLRGLIANQTFSEFRVSSRSLAATRSDVAMGVGLSWRAIPRRLDRSVVDRPVAAFILQIIGGDCRPRHELRTAFRGLRPGGLDLLPWNRAATVRDHPSSAPALSAIMARRSCTTPRCRTPTNTKSRTSDDAGASHCPVSSIQLDADAGRAIERTRRGRPSGSPLVVHRTQAATGGFP